MTPSKLDVLLELEQAMARRAKPANTETKPQPALQIIKPAVSNGTSALPRNVAQAGSALLAIINQAASHVREVSASAREQEEHVQQLLLQVRADVQDAHARVQAAEVRAYETEQRAQAEVAAANERVAAAEERAREAEAWFARITEAVRQEFELAQDAAPDAAQAEVEAAA